MTRFVASSLLLASYLVAGSEGFAPSRGISAATVIGDRQAQQSTLNALFSDDDQTDNDDTLSRRDVGSRIAMLASAFATTFTSTDAFAEEEGRLIKFEVENLDGGGSGSFTVRTRPDWAPKGVQRFETLTDTKFWDGCRVFRVLPGFIAQVSLYFCIRLCSGSETHTCCEVPCERTLHRPNFASFFSSFSFLCQFGITGDPQVQAKWRSVVRLITFSLPRRGGCT